MKFWFDRISIRARIFLLVLTILVPVAGILAWHFADGLSAHYEVTLWQTLGIGAGVWLLALGGAWWLSAAIVKPIAELARAAAAVASGRSEVRAEVTGAPEIASVARQFNRMLDARDLGDTRLRAIFEAASDAIVTANDAQVIVMANPAAAKMFGYKSVDELIGAPLERLIPERFRARHRFDMKAFGDSDFKLRAMGRPMQLLGLRADGTEFALETSISHLSLGGQSLFTAMHRDLLDVDRAQAEQVRSHADLQRLVVAQEQIREGERKRIARELHDDLQQTLGAIRMLVGSMRDASPGIPVATAAMLAEIDGLASAAIDSTRRIINNLRPHMLEDLGLVPALEVLIAQFNKRTGLACRLDVQDGAGDALLDAPGVTTCLYRVAQEALHNAANHAQASSVQVRLSGPKGGRVTLRISDNGIGIRSADRLKPQSFGLLGMRERVRALGGVLKVDGQPGDGTVVEVSVPVSDAAPG
ncbi:MAG: PAS domain S-box protein [Rubrivivax sp.]|nr:PAS domain S-box protein [Rubrivivax sp.]